VGGGGNGFGQSAYLRHIDQACDANDDDGGVGGAGPGTGPGPAECTRAVGSYLDALEGGGQEAVAVAVATPPSSGGAARILGYLDSIASTSASASEEVAPTHTPGGGYLDALSPVGRGSAAYAYASPSMSPPPPPPPPVVWASPADSSGGPSAPPPSSLPTAPAGTTPVPPPQGQATTITIGSTTNVQNVEALQNLSREEEGVGVGVGVGVVARSIHEEEGGDATTETTVTREGADTVVTITSTTRIVLPR